MIWITVNSVAQALLIELRTFFVGPVFRHPRPIVRVLLHVRDPNAPHSSFDKRSLTHPFSRVLWDITIIFIYTHTSKMLSLCRMLSRGEGLTIHVVDGNQYKKKDRVGALATIPKEVFSFFSSLHSFRKLLSRKRQNPLLTVAVRLLRLYRKSCKTKSSIWIVTMLSMDNSISPPRAFLIMSSPSFFVMTGIFGV